MSDWSYSDDELQDYFKDAGSRKPKKGLNGRLVGWWQRRLGHERKAEAAARRKAQKLGNAKCDPSDPLCGI
jgi:hypothetical protein